MIRALWDVTWLAVLIAVGAECGILFSHLYHIRGATLLLAWGFAYTGAAGFVGFGLVNRILLRSAIQFGGVGGLFILAGASMVIGEVALPFVIVWRVSTVLHHLILVVRRFMRSRRGTANATGLAG